MITTLAPIAFIILAGCLVFIAYGERKQPIIFEVFFMIGGLFALAASMSIFNNLEMLSITFSGVVLPIFSMLMWAYLILLFILFVRLLLHVLDLIKYSVKKTMGMIK